MLRTSQGRGTEKVFLTATALPPRRPTLWGEALPGSRSAIASTAADASVNGALMTARSARVLPRARSNTHPRRITVSPRRW